MTVLELGTIEEAMDALERENRTESEEWRRAMMQLADLYKLAHDSFGLLVVPVDVLTMSKLAK